MKQKLSIKSRGNYMSLLEFIGKYYTNIQACIEFFFNLKWPDGFHCDKCGNTSYYFIKSRGVYRCKACHHDNRLLSQTIFQDCKLSLNKLLMGLYLIFSSNKGISALELAMQLECNYKTAALLERKSRILMKDDNRRKSLDSKFYESDVAYIGTKTPSKRGMGTEKQPVLVVLATDRENNYPRFIKIKEITKDCTSALESFFSGFIKINSNSTLNTDGKTTYSFLDDKCTWKHCPIDYNEKDHRLFYTNIIISNMKSNINGIYHGVDKRIMPLFLSEFEWRFNHRRTEELLLKIRNCIQRSYVCTRKDISNALTEYMYNNMFADIYA